MSGCCNDRHTSSHTTAALHPCSSRFGTQQKHTGHTHSGWQLCPDPALLARYPATPRGAAGRCASTRLPGCLRDAASQQLPGAWNIPCTGLGAHQQREALTHTHTPVRRCVAPSQAETTLRQPLPALPACHPCCTTPQPPLLKSARNCLLKDYQGVMDAGAAKTSRRSMFLVLLGENTTAAESRTSAAVRHKATRLAAATPRRAGKGGRRAAMAAASSCAPAAAPSPHSLQPGAATLCRVVPCCARAQAHTHTDQSVSGCTHTFCCCVVVLGFR